MFSDERGGKRRPAVVLSTGDYHRKRQEAIIAAITSNVDRALLGDHLIAGWREAGLLWPSTATGIIRTVKQSMIERRLGRMLAADMEAIRGQWRRMLAL
ncbi:type II toxin-antitoxin system PemK/MazF family toxin [Candidatus Amarolinea dominans]|uniref:type II toxin-antitoxin system PemK/MazF family toxin n=1 Tax=Candidatus Amarolinea dominans TaxID=3140696 RepID=UPI001DB2B80C|nr:type II toxin-antitoxin system PemK/MazF family toxin [Anaerolineae bacterium]